MAKKPYVDLGPDTILGAEHIKRYQESGGEDGHLWNGVPTLLLTTIGRKSGEKRISPMIYTPYGDVYLVIASQGGAPSHPNWYFNLSANPEVEIQVGPDVMAATARTASEEEKPAMWDACTDNWPNFDLYQSRTERPIPVVVLTPKG